MNRLNLQTAWRFNRTGKQRTRVAEVLDRWHLGDAKFCQLNPQSVVIQHGPSAQPLKQPVLHLGCRSFGVGETQDVLRFDIFQQQSRDTVR